MSTYTGEVLNPAFVRQAKGEELKYFRGKHVWRVVPRSRAAGNRIVGTRWVCTNKGDDLRPDVRCRFVAQEVKTYQSEEFFAATPPIETLRMILSFAAEHPSLQVSFVDISRAYFNAKIGRDAYVELPPEAGHGSEYLGQLVKCMYGTRDAAQGWEGTYRDGFKSLGFRRGRSSPCVFTHTTRKVKLAVLAVGSPADLRWYEAGLLKLFEGRVKGILAFPGDELRILNQVARRIEDGYEWEADPRHAEILVRKCG